MVVDTYRERYNIVKVYPQFITELLQQEKRFKVHLVAKHFPRDVSGEYTSPWYIVDFYMNILLDS